MRKAAENICIGIASYMIDETVHMVADNNNLSLPLNKNPKFCLGGLKRIFRKVMTLNKCHLMVSISKIWHLQESWFFSILISNMIQTYTIKLTTRTSVSTLLVKCCTDKCLLPGKTLTLIPIMLNWWIVSIDGCDRMCFKLNLLETKWLNSSLSKR